eukprot:TRINITY_DN648_c1_g1_i1.p1 TRINITY_DN648_c1_g1~~TRINITY_DN648_c1_g1_i1.p1  ORF type:complete len:1795 (+),score=517.66 TRINITY_DN648_c1_g1_i1:80-5386(+)
MALGDAAALARHQRAFCVGGQYDVAIAQARGQQPGAAAAHPPAPAPVAAATTAVRILRGRGSVPAVSAHEEQQDRTVARLAAELAALKARTAAREPAESWAQPMPLALPQSPQRAVRHGRRRFDDGRPHSSEEMQAGRLRDALDHRRGGSASAPAMPGWDVGRADMLGPRLQAGLARLRGALEARGEAGLLEQLAAVEKDVGGPSFHPTVLPSPSPMPPSVPPPPPQPLYHNYGQPGVGYAPPMPAMPQVPIAGVAQLEAVVSQLAKHAEVLQQQMAQQQQHQERSKREQESSQLAAELAQLRRLLSKQQKDGREARASVAADGGLDEEELQAKELRRMDWELARMERQEVLSEARLALQRRREDWERDRDQQDRQRAAARLRRDWDEGQKQLAAEQALRRQLAQEGHTYQPPPASDRRQSLPPLQVAQNAPPPQPSPQFGSALAAPVYDSSAGFVIFFDLVHGLPRPGAHGAWADLGPGRGREIRVVYAVCDGARPVAAIREIAAAPAEEHPDRPQGAHRSVLAQKRRLRNIAASGGMKLICEVQLVTGLPPKPGAAPRTAPFGWSVLPLFDAGTAGAAATLAAGAWRLPLFHGPVTGSTQPAAMLSSHTPVLTQIPGDACELLVRVVPPSGASAAASVPLGSGGGHHPHYLLPFCFTSAAVPQQHMPVPVPTPAPAQAPVPRRASSGPHRTASQQHDQATASSQAAPQTPVGADAGLQPPSSASAATPHASTPRAPPPPPEAVLTIAAAAAAQSAATWALSRRAAARRRLWVAASAVHATVRLRRSSKRVDVCVGVQPVDAELSADAAALFGGQPFKLTLKMYQRGAGPRLIDLGPAWEPRAAPNMEADGRARWSQVARRHWKARVRVADAGAEVGSPLGAARPRSAGGGQASPVYVLAELSPAGADPVLWARLPADAAIARSFAPLIGSDGGAEEAEHRVQLSGTDAGWAVRDTVVVSCTAGGPAAEAGVEVGSRVLAIGGCAVASDEDIRRELFVAAGQLCAIKLLRPPPRPAKAIVGRVRAALRKAPADAAAPPTPRRQRTDDEDANGIISVRLICRPPPQDADTGFQSDPDTDLSTPPPAAELREAAPPVEHDTIAREMSTVSQQPRRRQSVFTSRAAEVQSTASALMRWVQPLHVPCRGAGVLAQPLLPGDLIDVFVDGARWLPHNVCVSRVEVSLWQVGSKRGVFEQVAPRVTATQNLRTESAHPRYAIHSRLPRGPWHNSLFLLCEVRAVSSQKRRMCSAAYCCVPLFRQSAQTEPQQLLTGGRAVRLRAGPLPARSMGPDMCDSLPSLPPCCSLLLRVARAPAGAEMPPLTVPRYQDGVYDSSACEPTKMETRLWRRRKDARTMYPDDMLTPEVRRGDAEAMRSFLAETLERPGEATEVLDYGCCSKYTSDAGVAVRVDGIENVPVQYGVPSVHKVMFRFEGGEDWYGTARHHWGAPGGRRSGDRSYPCFRDTASVVYKGYGDTSAHVILVVISVRGWRLDAKPDTIEGLDLAIDTVGWCRYPLFSTADYATHGRFRTPLISGPPPTDSAARVAAAAAAEKDGNGLMPHTAVSFTITDALRSGELPATHRPRRCLFPPGSAMQYPEHSSGEPARLHTTMPKACGNVHTFEQGLNVAFAAAAQKAGFKLFGAASAPPDPPAPRRASTVRRPRQRTSQPTIDTQPPAVSSAASLQPVAPVQPPPTLTLILKKNAEGKIGLLYLDDMVTGVREGGAAEAAGVGAGMKLISIAGRPVEPNQALVAAAFRDAPAEFEITVVPP